jgi:hypothetical protein
MITNQITNKTSVLYLIFTFAISWGSWGILAALSHYQITHYGQPVFMLLYLLGGLGPFIAAFIVNKKYETKEDYKQFIKKLFRFKVDFAWYAWIIIVPFVISSIPWLIAYFTKGTVQPLFKGPFFMVFAMLPVMIIGGGLEEVGWRGVLLPCLLKRNNLVVATLITGFIWAIWHLPLWFIKGLPQADFNFVVFFLSVYGITFLLSVLYTFTESIFLCILCHSLFNSYGNNLNSFGINPFVEAAAKLVVSIGIFIIYQIIMARINSVKPVLKS